MSTFKFTGKVLPFFEQFTMLGTVSAKWNDYLEPHVSLVMSAEMSIQLGIVRIDCESNLHGTENYDGQVALRAERLARSFVATYSFASGRGLDVLLDTVVKPDGILYSIREFLPHLAELSTVFSRAPEGGIDVEDVATMALIDSTIYLALTDLADSLTQILLAPVKCARAIEAIRLAITPASDRKQGWLAMRNNLNLSEAYLKLITRESEGPRHADINQLAFDVTHEIISRSWNIMNRFLEFKKGGDQPLSPSDFPLLDN